jgi:hypothetical protein
MQEKDLYTSAIEASWELEKQGIRLGSHTKIAFELQASILASCPGALILPCGANDTNTHEVIRGLGTEKRVPDTTLDNLWSCTKKHYGLTTAAVLTGAAGIPISKTTVGAWVHAGSSKTTNISSLIGLRFFPRTLIKQPTVAKLAKATFGTVRVFGVIGRAVPFVAIGMAVFDLVSISLCAYEAERDGE